MKTKKNRIKKVKRKSKKRIEGGTNMKNIAGEYYLSENKNNSKTNNLENFIEKICSDKKISWIYPTAKILCNTKSNNNSKYRILVNIDKEKLLFLFNSNIILDEKLNNNGTINDNRKISPFNYTKNGSWSIKKNKFTSTREIKINKIGNIDIEINYDYNSKYIYLLIKSNNQEYNLTKEEAEYYYYNTETKSPITESPKTESLRRESPKTESLKRKSPKTESLRRETPKTESLKRESPKTESLRRETPKTESLKRESPKTESPITESPYKKDKFYEFSKLGEGEFKGEVINKYIRDTILKDSNIIKKHKEFLEKRR